MGLDRAELQVLHKGLSRAPTALYFKGYHAAAAVPEIFVQSALGNVCYLFVVVLTAAEIFCVFWKIFW